MMIKKIFNFLKKIFKKKDKKDEDNTNYPLW